MSGGQRVVAALTATDINAGRTFPTPNDPALRRFFTGGGATVRVDMVRLNVYPSPGFYA